MYGILNVELAFVDPTGDILGTDPLNGWQSYLKSPLDMTAIFFPLGCSLEVFLSNPPSKSLDPELMVPCWPRYVNHSCDPTAVLVKVDVDNGFVLPDIPWKKVVASYQVVVLQGMDKGSEISFNYEDLPQYILRETDGFAECNKTHDEL